MQGRDSRATLSVMICILGERDQQNSEWEAEQWSRYGRDINLKNLYLFLDNASDDFKKLQPNKFPLPSAASNPLHGQGEEEKNINVEKEKQGKPKGNKQELEKEEKEERDKKQEKEKKEEEEEKGRRRRRRKRRRRRRRRRRKAGRNAQRKGE